MPRLRLLSAARADLLDIFDFIAKESGSRKVARRFVEAIRDRCAELARLPATMGVARPELLPDIRSVSFRNYLIFFRYSDGDFEVIGIVHGSRDLLRARQELNFPPARCRFPAFRREADCNPGSLRPYARNQGAWAGGTFRFGLSHEGTGCVWSRCTRYLWPRGSPAE